MLTYKYRLYPTKNQTITFNQTLNTCRILYNSCLLDRKNAFENTKKGLTYNYQASILTKDKQRIESLNNIHSQILQDVLKRVDKSYKNFFRRVKTRKEKAGYPRFKPENRYTSFTYPQSGFKIGDKKLKLSKIGTVKLKLHRSIQGSIKTCTIKKELDKWYVCFSVEYTPVKRNIPNKAIGVDVGLNNFATLSTGEVIDNPNYLRSSEKKLTQKQRQLSKKKKGSKNKNKARVKVTKIHLKIRNQRNDFLHKVSKYIVDNFNYIVIEDLNIKNMLKNHNLAKSISDASWGIFLNYLIYKAENAGSKIFKVDPKYTSIICSNCGCYVFKTLSDRIHICPQCNISLDRDLNASLNILNRAGTAQIKACGDSRYQTTSMKQEAPEFIQE